MLTAVIDAGGNELSVDRMTPALLPQGLALWRAQREARVAAFNDATSKMVIYAKQIGVKSSLQPDSVSEGNANFPRAIGGRQGMESDQDQPTLGYQPGQQIISVWVHTSWTC